VKIAGPEPGSDRAVVRKSVRVSAPVVVKIGGRALEKSGALGAVAAEMTGFDRLHALIHDSGTPVTP